MYNICSTLRSHLLGTNLFPIFNPKLCILSFIFKQCRVAIYHIYRETQEFRLLMASKANIGVHGMFTTPIGCLLRLNIPCLRLFPSPCPLAALDHPLPPSPPRLPCIPSPLCLIQLVKRSLQLQEIAWRWANVLFLFDTFIQCFDAGQGEACKHGWTEQDMNIRG